MISLKDIPLYCETLTSSKYSEHVIDDLKNVGLHCNYSALDDDFFNIVKMYQYTYDYDFEKGKCAVFYNDELMCTINENYIDEINVDVAKMFIEFCNKTYPIVYDNFDSHFKTTITKNSDNIIGDTFTDYFDSDVSTKYILVDLINKNVEMFNPKVHDILDKVYNNTIDDTGNYIFIIPAIRHNEKYAEYMIDFINTKFTDEDFETFNNMVAKKYNKEIGC